MSKGTWGTVSRVAVSLTAIVVILYVLHDKLDEALHILKSDVKWGGVAIAFLIYILCFLVQALRLHVILRVPRIILRFRETVYLCMVGLFFNLMLPSAVGGDVAKVYYAGKHSGKLMEATTSVILDRLMGFVSVVLIALAAIGVMRNEFDQSITNYIYFFLGLMVFVVLFFASKRIARPFQVLTQWIPKKIYAHLHNAYHAVHQYRDHKRTLLLGVFLSFFSQALIIMIYYWLAASMGVRLNPWIFFVIVPIIFVVSMAPSVGGLGVREAGAIYFFSRYMATEQALALSILMDIVMYGASLACGVIYMIRGGLKAKTIHEIEELEAGDVRETADC